VKSNRAMLLVDERCLQSDLVGADRIVPVASVAAGRDLDASSLTKIFAPKRNDVVVKTGLKCLGKCISPGGDNERPCAVPQVRG
jgi:hypothetical protein